MPEDTRLEGNYMFRGIEYVICMSVTSTGSLTVVVEDRLTANQWKGTFDSAYIEDMTHKTGNYKQFHVFVNMLESAVSQTSDTVSLDLLTFSDLELLRKRKAGVGTQSIPGANNPSLTQKRYLILTYSVEFDKIHYPLPLPYAGKPDPEILQETIRRLQAELKALKSQESKDFRMKEFERLKVDFDTLLAEKEAIEREHLLYRKEVKHTTEGAAAKEIRILKSVVKNLEEEMMKEKAKYQRATGKRRKEFQDLLEEVQELRASERNLKVRLKSLTNELAIYKRKAISAEHPSHERSSRSRQDTSSYAYQARDRSRSREGRPASRERFPLLSHKRTPSQERLHGDRRSLSQERSRLRQRSRSGERIGSGDRHHSLERPRSQYDYTPSPHSGLRPSPAGARLPRFDPTTYVEDKRKKQTAAKTRISPVVAGKGHSGSGKKNRPQTAPPVSSRPRRGTVPRREASKQLIRTSSIESLGSQGSAVRSRQNSYSDNDLGILSDSSQGHRRIRTNQNVNWSADSPECYVNSRPARNVPSTSTPDSRHLRKHDTDNTGYHNRTSEMDDIDARLQRIQEMMREAM